MAERGTKGLEVVREIFNRNKTDLLGQFNALGAGIGKIEPTDESYVITIYLADEDSIPKESIDIEGIPLKFVVSGRFRKQL